MSLLQRTLAPGKKPGKHPIDPALEWVWALDGIRSMAPMWSGAGGVRLYAPTLRETIALNAGVTWSRGPEGRALDYDGTGDAWLRTSATYDWTQAFTVVGLMSFAELASDHAMGASRGGASWSWQCWMDTGNTNFAIATRSGGGSVQVANGGTATTTDRFLLGIGFDGVDQWKLWVDGENPGTITESSIETGTNELHIGTSNELTGAGKNHDGRYFTHYHWGRELSAAEHRQLARDPFGPFRMARRTWSVVQTAAGALSIPVATAHYRQQG